LYRYPRPFFKKHLKPYDQFTTNPEVRYNDVYLLC
jgi:hypothetical protein